MRRLYLGDNLDVLRAHFATASVELVYLDPPSNPKAASDTAFKSPAGSAGRR